MKNTVTRIQPVVRQNWFSLYVGDCKAYDVAYFVTLQILSPAFNVLLAAKAKHPNILKKIWSVPFFVDHLHLTRYNIAAVSKRFNKFLFYLEIRLKKTSLYQSSKLFQICPVCLSVSSLPLPPPPPPLPPLPPPPPPR